MERRNNENVCKNCKYYQQCNKPERFMKCLGYIERTAEREKENE